MPKQVPKDCICRFTLDPESSSHESWCPAAKRLAKRKAIKDELKAEDEYGRWQAGVGPKPDWIDNA